MIHQKKFEDALNYAKAFHKSGKMMEISSLYLGVIYFEMIQLELSLKYFNISLKFNSRNYDVLVNKAAVLNKLDKNEEAKKLLDNAIKINLTEILYRNYAAIYEDESNFIKQRNITKRSKNQLQRSPIYI